MMTARTILRCTAAVGLAVDAGIHLKLAGQYDAVTASISEGALFRVEAVAAVLAIVLVLVWRNRAGDAFAWLTAAAGLAAIIVYRYWNPGAIGPLPDMYEPVWFTDKLWALTGQALALLALTPLLLRPARGGDHADPPVDGPHQP
jgi:hypothetical protein